MNEQVTPDCVLRMCVEMETTLAYILVAAALKVLTPRCCGSVNIHLYITKRLHPSSELCNLFVISGCGSQIRTDDLRVMSPTSYRAAPSRDISTQEVFS